MKSNNPQMTFLENLPETLEGFKSLVQPYGGSPCIVCFDDYEQEMTENSTYFKQIWTVLSHHLNITCIALVHNLFAKDLRSISLNTHRLVLMKSLRDSQQFSYLSRQCFPHVKNFLPAVYQQCVKSQDFPYIILNFSPGKESDNYIKVLTRIFKYEFPMTAFRPIECSKNSKNPYEQLVLINQNLYNVLKNNQLKDNCSAEPDQDHTSTNNTNSNKLEVNNISNNTNNIENNGERLSGDTAGRNVQPLSFDRGKNDNFDEGHLQPIDEQNAVPNEFSREKELETSDEQNNKRVSFNLPPLKELFNKKREQQEQEKKSSDPFKSKHITKRKKKSNTKPYGKVAPLASKSIDFNSEKSLVENAKPPTISRSETQLRNDKTPSTEMEVNGDKDLNEKKNNKHLRSFPNQFKSKRSTKGAKNLSSKPYNRVKPFVNKSSKSNNENSTIENNETAMISRNEDQPRSNIVSSTERDVNPVEELNATNNMSKRAKKRRAIPVINRALIPFKKRKVQNIEDSKQSKKNERVIVSRKAVKRSAIPKINRSLIPFKKRRIQNSNESEGYEPDKKSIVTKKALKRRALPKINRSLIPFKKRKLQGKDEDKEVIQKRAKKRKGKVLINADIHPFKIARMFRDRNNDKNVKAQEENKDASREYLKW